MENSKTRLLAKANMLQDCLDFKSVKKARIVTGISKTNKMLGCRRMNINAIMQKKNWDIGAKSFAKNEKLLLHTLVVRLWASTMNVSWDRCF